MALASEICPIVEGCRQVRFVSGQNFSLDLKQNKAEIPLLVGTGRNSGYYAWSLVPYGSCIKQPGCSAFPGWQRRETIRHWAGHPLGASGSTAFALLARQFAKPR